MQQLALDQKIAALRRFSRLFAQRLGALEAAPAGSSYSATEVRVLAELAQDAPRTVTALSRSLGLDAGYLSRVIRRLESTGIVSKAPDSSDSRQQPLSLTSAGRAEVQSLETVTTARYAALVRTLPSHVHAPLLDAMERIEGALSADVPPRDTAPWMLRAQRAGDIAHIAQIVIASASEEFEIGGAFEVTTLRTATGFLEQHDPSRDCCWIADRDGSIIGSVMLRQCLERTAQLTMLHVESRARGIGIGRRLMAEAIDFAGRANCTRIDLELLEVMKTARFLAHAAGFRHVGEVVDDAYGRRLARQQWQLDLAPGAPEGRSRVAA